MRLKQPWSRQLAKNTNSLFQRSHLFILIRRPLRRIYRLWLICFVFLSQLLILPRFWSLYPENHPSLTKIYYRPWRAAKADTEETFSDYQPYDRVRLQHLQSPDTFTDGIHINYQSNYCFFFHLYLSRWVIRNLFLFEAPTSPQSKPSEGRGRGLREDLKKKNHE